jgi:hypothetical protein
MKSSVSQTTTTNSVENVSSRLDQIEDKLSGLEDEADVSEYSEKDKRKK